MALPLLFMIGGTLVRAAGPTIARELAKLGAKKLAGKAATEAAKKGTAKLINNSNLGVVRTLARPGAKAADKVDDLAAGVTRTISRGTKPKPTVTPKPSATTKPSATAKPQPSTTAKPKTATGAGKPTMAKPKPTTKPSSTAKPKPSTTAKPKTRPTTPPPRPATGGPKSVIKPLLGAAGVAGTMMGVSTLGGGDKGKSKAAMPLPKPKPKVQGPPMGPSRVSGSDTEAGRPKVPVPTSFNKGANTGFGINASTFVGGPEERAVMMKYYGGTGKEAAKAAMAGTQGKLKELGMDALKKELAAAKAIRFKRDAAKTKNNKTGGKMKSYKKGGKIGMKKKPEVVARQMRGWGKARKPKR